MMPRYISVLTLTAYEDAMMEFMGTVPTPPVPGQKVGTPLRYCTYSYLEE
jgi:hypothetical protein